MTDFDYTEYSDAEKAFDKQEATRKMRKFDSGATRDDDTEKLDYEGFLSPLVLQRYAQYMHKCSAMHEGNRDSDNWQKGIPRDQYMKSAWRHFMEVWSLHRNPNKYKDEYPNYMEEALCALLFNVMGYLHEKEKQGYVVDLDTTPPPAGWGDL